MNLQSCLNTYIGDEKMKGVSGGELKRVSIAIELLRKPPVLILVRCFCEDFCRGIF